LVASTVPSGWCTMCSRKMRMAMIDKRASEREKREAMTREVCFVALDVSESRQNQQKRRNKYGKYHSMYVWRSGFSEEMQGSTTPHSNLLPLRTSTGSTHHPSVRGTSNGRQNARESSHTSHTYTNPHHPFEGTRNGRKRVKSSPKHTPSHTLIQS
jgi:hypothetical protein